MWPEASGEYHTNTMELDSTMVHGFQTPPKTIVQQVHRRQFFQRTMMRLQTHHTTQCSRKTPPNTMELDSTMVHGFQTPPKTIVQQVHRRQFFQTTSTSTTIFPKDNDEIANSSHHTMFKKDSPLIIWTHGREGGCGQILLAPPHLE